MAKADLIAQAQALGLSLTGDETVAQLEALLADNKPAEHTPKDPEAYEAFKAHIEAYKKQSPEKYELKREELERKLNAL